jgi:hypothetical protein
MIVGFFTVLILASVVPTQSPVLSPASVDLLHRATDPNPMLESYTASAKLSAVLHVLVPIHETFNGTAYYLKPKRKIVFENVPGPLSNFKELVRSTPTYEQAMAEYVITPLSDSGQVSTYSLIPKSSGGRVKSLTITVNDQSALITHAQWLYNNGGKLSFDPAYIHIGAFWLPSDVNISARFPGYSVDGSLSFSNYAPNAPVSPSVFVSPSPPTTPPSP